MIRLFVFKTILNMKKIVIYLLGSVLSLAQTAEEREKIINTYNVDEINTLKQFIQQDDINRSHRVNTYLAKTGKSLYQEVDGRKREVRDILPDGTVLYYQNDNDGSALTMRAKRLYPGGSLGLELTGQDIEVGVWEAEGGIPLASHLDLNGKITVIDGANDVTFHATHVAGTIVSSGEQTVFNQGRGVAYGATVRAADSQSDYSEMTTEANNGMLISNHSYGYGAENVPLWMFGAYGSDAFNVDFICRTFPYYVPVLSAGNDRGDYALYNPSKGGYDLLNGDKVSKNGITVAAINQVLSYTGPNSVGMSSFSNWGGTDDGRIKPDISAKGVGVYSTSSSSDIAYANSQGTSMASPGISGLLALLQEHYNNVNNQYMLAATAKGLLLHTADEAGINQGPDYKFGWGVPNGGVMATTITQSGQSTYVSEKSLDANQTETINVIASGDEPLKVSISWTDKPGQTSNQQDDTTPVLVNDLDVKLTKSGEDFYPWKLTTSNYNLGATRNSTNDVDNFERVDVDTPNAGDVYQLTISHKGTLDGASQNYSLIITGGIPENMSTNNVATAKSEISVFPNPVMAHFNMRNENEGNPWNFVEILDATSKIVHAQKLEQRDNQVQVQANKLLTGVYYLRIYTEKGIVNKKIIKK